MSLYDKKSFQPILHFKYQSIDKFLILNNALEFTEIAFDLSCESNCIGGVTGGSKERQITKFSLSVKSVKNIRYYCKVGYTLILYECFPRVVEP